MARTRHSESAKRKLSKRGGRSKVKRSRKGVETGPSPSRKEAPITYNLKDMVLFQKFLKLQKTMPSATAEELALAAPPQQSHGSTGSSATDDDPEPPFISSSDDETMGDVIATRRQMWSPTCKFVRSVF